MSPANCDIVSEGRDQGTVAFPLAECKIFLDRFARREGSSRQARLAARGEKLSLRQVLADQNQRDKRDATREVGPLVPAADAMVVTTDGLSAEQVVDRLEACADKDDGSRNVTDVFQAARVSSTYDFLHSPVNEHG